MPTSTLTVVGHRIGAVLTAVVSGAVIALTVAPGASAQEPGVHVDPGSPTGKEYGIPVNQARSEAAPSQSRRRSRDSSSGGSPSSGGSSSGGSSSGDPSANGAIPFGQGVATGARHAASSRRSAARHRTASGRPKLAPSATSGPGALPAASDIGSGSDSPTTLAIAVLVAGGLAGLATRFLVRRRASA